MSVGRREAEVHAVAGLARGHVTAAFGSALAYPASLLVRGDRETLLVYLEARYPAA